MKHRERYLRPLDAIGHHKVADVEKRHIIAIRNAIAAASGNGAATAFARAASVLFGWAVEAGWITHSPTYRMKALPIGAWQAWTPEQAETALSSLPEHYRRVVVLGLLTGQRRGDLCALRWSNYDGDRLMIVQQKTGSVVSLSVHPELKAELDAWPRVAETILTNAFGKPWNPEVLSTTLPYQLGKLGVSGVNVHGMRKLFAAGMAGAGATTHQIAANTGHKTLAMVQRYTEAADQKKLSDSAVGKIQTFTTARKILK
jgi:integrase